MEALCAVLLSVVLLYSNHGNVHGTPVDTASTGEHVVKSVLKVGLSLAALSSNVSAHSTEICEMRATMNSAELKVLEMAREMWGDIQEMIAFNNRFSVEIALQNATLERLDNEMELLKIPNRIDTCPDGYTHHERSCYKIGEGKATWTAASDMCASSNAHLAIEDTPEEQDYLKAMVVSHRGDCYWVGATDAFVEGQWIWLSSGLIASSLDWHPGQPNNYRVSNCACLFKTFGYGLVDEPCHHRYNYVCEINLSD